MHPQSNYAYYRYFPFAIFMLFIGFEEIVHFAADRGLLTTNITTFYYLYPFKVLIVAYLLFRYRDKYNELDFNDLCNLPVTIAVTIAGLLAFVLWINLDMTFSLSPTPQDFNPTHLTGGWVRVFMTASRVCGAVLVVPLMEELFWRSFLIRYIIKKNIQSVPLALFTWPSFLLSVLLFGTEHNFILAGMMAGTFYNITLYKTRSIAQCVLAHAVTNLALAIYVLLTGKWYFW